MARIEWTALIVFLQLWFFVATRASASISKVIFVASSSRSVNDSSCWRGGDKQPCATIDLGMEGLWNLSQSTEDITVLSIATIGIHVLSSSAPTDFNRSGPLMIVGNGNTASSGANVVIECERGVGLSFVYVRNVTLEGVAFYRCGAIRTSTSYNFNTSNPDYLLFHVGLYFLYCADITMRNITVAGTSGTAVVMYNTVGLNRIEHCTFLENIYNATESHPSGGSVCIEFSYCDPGSIECLTKVKPNTNQSYTHGAEYLFLSSNFLFNYAYLQNFTESAFILPFKIYHLTFGRGGAISMFFKGNASNNSITIQDCLFQGNRAVWGGALFIEFQDQSYNNNCTVSGSTIIDNHLKYNDSSNVGTGGGGARVDYLFFRDFEAYGNKVLFERCQFIENSAYWGGGLSLYAAEQNVTSENPPNTFTMVDCNLTNNTGRLGAALDLSLWHTVLSGKRIAPQIIGCRFESNSVYNSTNHGLIGIGAVYIDTLPVQFSGTNTFEDNIGTAMVVFGTAIILRSGGRLEFLRNTGRRGGAIAFLGSGSIVMDRDTHLRFIKNSAEYQGGGIYAYRSGEHDLISSRNCFIRYYQIETSPDDWTTSFYFRGNTANNSPNSIYASTILPCVWGTSYGSAQNSEILKKNAFCWNNWTFYDNPTNCSKEIASAPASYTTMHQYTAIPGKILPLGMVAYDELGNNVTDTAIYLAQIKSGNASFQGEISNYDHISKNFINLYGQPNSTVHLQIETSDPIVIRSEIEIRLQNCPPGFIRSKSDSINTTVCECPQAGKRAAFAGYVRCHGEQFYSEILRHTWMGYVTVNGRPETVVRRSPYVNDISSDEYIPLPIYSDNLTEFFCSKLNRKGVMCGSCIVDYGPSVTSNACVYCPEGTERYSWLLYILAVYLPMTVFFVCVFLFSMSAFGPLNAFIFFAQVITTVAVVDAEGTVLFDSLANNDSISLEVMHSFRALYTVLYDIWNLNFFLPLIPPFCLSSKINSATLQCLSYLSALYPLILLALLSLTIFLYNRGVRPCVVMFRPFHRCLARMRGWLKLRQPIAGGIAIFLVISYTKFTFVSFELLIPAPLYNASGTVVKQVLYIDGDIDFGSQSALYISISTVLLIVFGFVPPIILVLPSLLHAVGKVCHHPIIGKFQPSGKAQQFLDVFHGRYKDGTNSTIDCRWFAGLYFALRLVLFATYLADSTWLYQYTLQIIIYNGAAFLFAVVRPYKEDWINNVDTMIFLNLAIIVTLSNYNLSLARSGYDISLWAYTLQCILIMVPLIYCISYFVILIFYRRLKRCCHLNFLTLLRSHPRSLDTSTNGVTANVKNKVTTTEVGFWHDQSGSNGIESFLDFTHAAGRLDTPVQETLTNAANWLKNEKAADAERAHLLSETDEDDELTDNPSNNQH